MPHALRHFPQFSVEINREVIPVDTMIPSKVPDEKWRHVDKEGHGHFWKDGEVPTLEWVVTGTRWVGDEYEGEEYEVGEYRCRLCAEVVSPGMRVEYDAPPVFGPTQVTVTINGESFPLNQEQYAESVEAWAEWLRRNRG